MSMKLQTNGPLCDVCEGSTDTYLLPQGRGICEKCVHDLGLELCEHCMQLRPALAFLFFDEHRMCAICGVRHAALAHVIHESFFKMNHDILDLLHPVQSIN